MPWIAKAKEPYRNVVQKDEFYIVKKSDLISDQVKVIDYDLKVPILLLTVEDCRQMFHTPFWMNE